MALQTPGTIAGASLRLTIKSTAGAAIGGCTDVTPSPAGVVDLTSLTVAASGTHPSFEVTALGASGAAAALITASVRYASDPPQQCLNVVVRHVCPSLPPGLSSGPNVPMADLVLGGQAVATTGRGPIPTPLPASMTRADMAGCIRRALGQRGPGPIDGSTVAAARRRPLA